MKEEVFHIATNIDDNYLQYCVVMLTSLFKNNPEKTFGIHILSQGLSTTTQETLERCVRKFGNEHQLSFYNIDNAIIHQIPQAESNHISPASNCRLFTADLLPSHLTQVLYLDCDLLVHSPIDTLFHLTIKDYAVAAVEDVWSGQSDNYERLGYESKYGYFNAGVMVINLEWWRKHQMVDLITSFLKNHRELKFMDQDILNGIFHQHWLQLPLIWNVQDGFLRKKIRIREKKIPEMLEAAQHPAIIHFTGGKKPWGSRCLNPYRHLFFEYMNDTEWKGWKPQISLRDQIKEWTSNLLLSLKLKPRKYRKI